MLGAGSLATLIASQASADVIVQLRSGTTLHATRYWTEGDTVELENYAGVMGLPRSAIESIAEDTSAPPTTAAAKAAAASSRSATATAPSTSANGAASGTTTAVATAPSNAAASTGGETTRSVDTDLYERPNEDLEAHMLRLDKLLVATNRQLSEARFQHKSDAELEPIQHRVDAINAHRQDLIRRLRAMR